MKPATLPERFLKNLALLCPDYKQSIFLVAFSGGLDSTALVHLMGKTVKAENLILAHLNHQLRGSEAERDQRFCHSTAESLGLRLIIETRAVRELAARRRKGLEDAARKARYDFLASAAEAVRARYILTAHQADDQAETMLMSLIKGAGAGGLAGIHPRRTLIPEKGEMDAPPLLLRPLLPFSRAELKVWLLNQGHQWVEDSTNADTHYLRNALRADILPRLTALNPRLLQAVSRGSTILRDEEDFWKEHLTDLWASAIAEEKNGLISFKVSFLLNISKAEQRRLIYEGLLKLWRARPHRNEPLTFEGVEMALELLAGKRCSGLDLPGGLRAGLSKGLLELTQASRFLKGKN